MLKTRSIPSRRLPHVIRTLAATGALAASAALFASGCGSSSGAESGAPGNGQTAAPTPVPTAGPGGTGALQPPSLTLTKLSTDPYNNADGQHETAMETSIFSEGDTLISSFMIGRRPTGGTTGIGFAVSRNRGGSWESGTLKGTTSVEGGSFTSVFDPVTAYDRKHGTWMISYAAELGGGGRAVLVSLSKDEGRTWSPPVTIARSSEFDKNRLTCDNSATSPHYGNCYAEFDDEGGGDMILMSRSTDGGLTWESPKGTADHAVGISGQPVVQPNGRVVVPILGASLERLFSFVSDDGGTTWSTTTPIWDNQYKSGRAGLRSAPNPSAAIDSSGRVYVAIPDCRLRPNCDANDILLITSDDGTHWSQPTRVNSEPISDSVDHIFPGLGWDPMSGTKDQARLGAVYYTVGTDNRVNAEYASSRDGGKTWSGPTRLAGPMETTWISTTPRGTLIGDYNSLAFAGGYAFPSFSVALAPTTREYYQGVYTFPQP